MTNGRLEVRSGLLLPNDVFHWKRLTLRDSAWEEILSLFSRLLHSSSFPAVWAKTIFTGNLGKTIEESSKFVNHVFIEIETVKTNYLDILLTAKILIIKHLINPNEGKFYINKYITLILTLKIKHLLNSMRINN